MNARKELLNGPDNSYSEEERREIAEEALRYLRDAESALWIVDQDLAREVRLLVDRVAK